MTRRLRALPAWAVALLALLAVLAGCGRDTTIRPDQVAGDRNGRPQTVLIDEPALTAIRPAMDPFLEGTPRRTVTYGAGSAADIATTVKDGLRIDLVVLPAGPALDRVREELIVPPAPIGRLAATQYWAAAVTARGLPCFAFLTSRTGAKALRAHGFT